MKRLRFERQRLVFEMMKYEAIYMYIYIRTIFCFIWSTNIQTCNAITHGCALVRCFDQFSKESECVFSFHNNRMRQFEIRRKLRATVTAARSEANVSDGRKFFSFVVKSNDSLLDDKAITSSTNSFNGGTLSARRNNRQPADNYSH